MNERDVGPKEAALRLMREAKLRQIMNPTKTLITYAGKSKGDNHPPGIGGRPKTNRKPKTTDPKRPPGRPKGWRKKKVAE